MLNQCPDCGKNNYSHIIGIICFKCSKKNKLIKDIYDIINGVNILKNKACYYCLEPSELDVCEKCWNYSSKHFYKSIPHVIKKEQKKSVSTHEKIRTICSVLVLCLQVVIMLHLLGTF